MKKIYRRLLTVIGVIGLNSLSWGQCFNVPSSFSSITENSVVNSKIVVADFDTDGNPDMATFRNGRISFFPGKGTGNFSSPINSVVDGFGARNAVGDFNGDGKPDIVGADYDTVSVVLNQGSGFFRKAINTPVYFDGSHRPSSIGVGDFNKDNKLDVVVISPFANKVSLLLGDGLGGFSTTTNYNLGAEGSQPLVLQVGDFNGDGNPDLVTGNSVTTSASGLSILLGDGRGGFSPVSTVGLSTLNLITMVSGDFNGDGKLDVAVGEQSPFIKGISILFGKGDGTFAGGGGINFGQGLVPEVYAGDFNVDGKLDLISSDINGGRAVVVWLGKGDGSFVSANRIEIGMRPGPLTIGDFNKDGKSDLSIYGSTDTLDPLIGVFLNCATVPNSTNLTLTPPAYDCATGQLILATTGGNGSTVEYRIAGLRDWAASNSFTVPAYQRNNTGYTLEARQSGQVISIPFTTTCQTAPPVTPPVDPNPPVIPPTGNDLSLTTPTYDCTSGLLTLATTGGNGNLVEYRIAGLRDWGTSNSFTVPAYQRTGTNFTLEARQSGQVASLPFTASCQTTPPTNPPVNPPTTAALAVSAQGLNCQSGALQLVTAGGDGTPIEYKVPGLANYSASATFTVPTYQRTNTSFTLYARQSGKEVTGTYMATCPVGARLASPEAAPSLEVVVYPNPVGEQFTVGVKGASGQAVRFHLTNLQGQTVVDQRAQVESNAHSETLKLPASGAGLYLLQVSTNGQSKTVKVLKP